MKACSAHEKCLNIKKNILRCKSQDDYKGDFSLEFPKHGEDKKKQQEKRIASEYWLHLHDWVGCKVSTSGGVYTYKAG